jgi:hypothetical protein
MLSTGFCAVADRPDTGTSYLPGQTSLNVRSRNFEIFESVLSGEKVRELIFEVVVENPSAVHKHDVFLPLNIQLKDEFGNVYLNRQRGNRSEPTLDDYKQLSLYPGEEVNFTFRFQSPVAAAKQLTVEVYDQEKVFYGRISYATNKIKNWNMISEGPKISSDDLLIVYPAEKRIFAPGDTIYLKVAFSETVGRPNSIYVVLPDYVLTDDEVKGQYELQISPDMPEGDFQVIVMAEWGESPRAQVVSKTLFLQIKG